MPNLVTCPCQHCNGQVQFDPATLSGENNKIACPNCGLETVLFVPPPTDARMETILSPGPPPMPPPSPAKTKAPWPFIIIASSILLLAYCYYHGMQGTQSGSLPTATPAPIIGAFGYTLGEKIPDSLQADLDEDGTSVSIIVDTTNFPPFDSIYVSALRDRRIYYISGNYYGGDWYTDRQILRVALEAKYGPAKSMAFAGSTTLRWGDDHREICLGEKPPSLGYTDLDLEGVHSKDRKAAQAKKAKSITQGL